MILEVSSGMNLVGLGRWALTLLFGYSFPTNSVSRENYNLKYSCKK